MYAGSILEREKMKNKSKINEVLNILEDYYPEAECALDHSNTFELLIAVTLSAQTTDKSVNKVTPALFEKYPTCQKLATASHEEVEDILRFIGMYKTKTKNIIALSQILTEKHDGIVPQDYDALVLLPGVGRKTANVVLSVGFGEERIAVDTHVFRVANRVGLAKAKDVLNTELQLMKNIDEKRWSRTHHSLIFHGRNICHAKKPLCDQCPIAPICEKNI